MNQTINWKRDFSFQKKQLFYNRIPCNHFAERAVEIPIAFDFLAYLKNKNKILEVGNVLSYYENSLSEYVGIRSRRIIDKFEFSLGVDNMDIMNISSEEKYQAIISISTVEHIGQGLAPLSPMGKFGERKKVRDLEAPLKAIAKIYDLLRVGGKALITVPFGKLIDGGWYIQFSKEYLDLIVTKFRIPEDAISLSFLKRITMEQSSDNPYQLWVEAEGKELSDIEYNASWDGAGAIVIIGLTKISDDFFLGVNVPSTNLVYGPPILIGSIYYTRFDWWPRPDANGVIYSEKRGFVFRGFYSDVPVEEYQLVFSIRVDVPCNLIFDVIVKESKENVLQAHILHSSKMHWTIKILPHQSHIEFRLFNCSDNPVKIYIQKFNFRKLQ